MKEKPLPSQSELKALYEYSVITGELIRKTNTPNGKSKAGDNAGIRHQKGLTVSIGGQLYFAHRIIWMLVTGEDPGNRQIDHRNKNPFDNSWINLRIATHRNNIHNQEMHKDNQCGAKGVRKTVSGRYQARILHEGKNISLGCYATIAEADAAYRRAELELRGEFARTSSQSQS